MSKRLDEFDFIRAVAALSVIAIHVTAGVATKNNLAFLWNQGVRYAVPLFILLSGFLLYFSDLKKGLLNTRDFYIKRVHKIIIPYLIWHIFYTLYRGWRVHDLANVLNANYIGTFVKNFFLGNGYGHLYFLPIIIQLYLIYPLLYRLIRKWPKSLLLVSLLITGVGHTLIYGHLLGWLVLPSSKIPYVIMFPLWLFFFVLGMFLARYYQAVVPFVARFKGAIFILWVLGLVWLIKDSKATGTYFSSVKPAIVFYTTISFFFLQMLHQILRPYLSKASKFYGWISYNSYFIYFAHCFLLDQLLLNLNKLKWSGVMNQIEGIGLVYLLTCAITFTAAWVVSYMPLCIYLGGVPAKRKIQGQKQVEKV